MTFGGLSVLADPQTITIDGVAVSLPRIKIEGTKTTYQSADGLHRLIVSYTDAKGNTRYLVRYEEDAVSSDPISAVNKKVSADVYLVIDQPSFGIDDTRVAKICAGLFSLLDATMLGKVLGNQT
jgi:hypothetical protein